MTGVAGMKDYLKHAFLFRWNLLAFIGGAAAAALSPWPDALLPLIGAVEVAYLGGLVSIPKFRSAIDMRVAQAARVPTQAAAASSLAGVVATLNPETRRRFDGLKARCLEMRAIARGMNNNQAATGPDVSTPALDKLLWVFLRLLVSEQALDRFLKSTSEAALQTSVDEAKRRLASAPQDPRFQRSLEDSVQAHEQRLANYRKAKENGDFVRLELDRIEVKIVALAESGVGSQDPDALSSQIEGVTESVRSTETAMRELQQITGIVDQMQEPPAILETDLRKVAQ